MIKHDNLYFLPPNAKVGMGLRVWVVFLKDSQAAIWAKKESDFRQIAHIAGKETGHGHAEEGLSCADAFMSELAVWLTEANDHDLFDRLVLISSEHNLSLFRKNITTDILASVAAQIPRDISDMTDKDSRKIMREIVGL